MNTSNEIVSGQARSLEELQASELEQLLALQISSSGLRRMLRDTMVAWHAAQRESDDIATSAPVNDAMHDRFYYDGMEPLAE